jgi:hypothetical protein
MQPIEMYPSGDVSVPVENAPVQQAVVQAPQAPQTVVQTPQAAVQAPVPVAAAPVTATTTQVQRAPAVATSTVVAAPQRVVQAPPVVKPATVVTTTAPTITTGPGRYELEMLTERGVKNTRVPALILDTYRGIIWTCQNLQDGRPLWVKTDLGKKGDRVMTHPKYIVRMLERQERELRVPAVVVDTELGFVWNCPNIVDGNAVWIGKDLSGNE